MADLVGKASISASRFLEGVRRGILEGVLHYLSICELAYHWRRGRVPFNSREGLLDFVYTCFTIEDVNVETALEAVDVKVLGDELLSSASEPKLRKRSLSISDATSIAVSRRKKIPFVTGDSGLAYVAKRMGVTVIW